MRALTPLRSKIRRRNADVVHDFGRLVASSVFDAALCFRSTSHNPRADEHDPSACGGQLLIVGLMMKTVLFIFAGLVSVYLLGAGWLIGLAARLICVDYKSPTSSEIVYLLKFFPLQSFVADKFNSVKELYEWQIGHII